MMAIGETDPTYPGLLEAFKQARSQAQVRHPVLVDPHVPDSHYRRLFRVRRAMQVERQQRVEFWAEPPEHGPECIRRGWEAVDGVDLQAEFRCRVRLFARCP